MHSLTFSLMGLLLAGNPQAELEKKPLDPAAVRPTVERSLAFLEKEGIAWSEKRKCSTCHHIPMMLWTDFEARRHGFTVNAEAMQRLQKNALKEYLGHPDHQPQPQDKSFPAKGPGPGAVYLTATLQRCDIPDDATTEALKKFTAKFAQQQDAQGHWPTKQHLAPLIDQTDGFTMWVLLTLDPKSSNDAERQAWQKGLAWLKKTPQRDEPQWLTLRVLLALKEENKAEVAPLLAKLREKQRPDGSWSQSEKLDPDALATGMATYALRKAGIPADDAAINRAVQFIVSSQKPDGSWLIKSRGTTGHHDIPSYYGTGWATIALLNTLPAVATKPTVSLAR